MKKTTLLSLLISLSLNNCYADGLMQKLKTGYEKAKNSVQATATKTKEAISSAFGQSKTTGGIISDQPVAEEPQQAQQEAQAANKEQELRKLINDIKLGKSFSMDEDLYNAIKQAGLEKEYYNATVIAGFIRDIDQGSQLDEVLSKMVEDGIGTELFQQHMLWGKLERIGRGLGAPSLSTEEQALAKKMGIQNKLNEAIAQNQQLTKQKNEREAKWQQLTDIVKEIQDHKNEAVTKNLNLNNFDADQQMLILTAAVLFHNVDIVRMLINAGLNVNAQGSTYTANWLHLDPRMTMNANLLHIAVQPLNQYNADEKTMNEVAAVIKMLIDAGVNPNAQDEDMNYYRDFYRGKESFQKIEQLLKQAPQ